jgi:precorrin-3B synthase
MLCACQAQADQAREAAENLGFIVDAGDPRNHVVACAGAPLCASAHLEARGLAERLAEGFADGIAEGTRLHVSGCEKRCVQPAGKAISIVGGPAGATITGEGVAVDPSLRTSLIAQARPYLSDRAA